jgi:hypothetical protein
LTYVQPVHVIAQYFYVYVIAPFYGDVYNLIEDFGPPKGDEEFDWLFNNRPFLESQMWAFIDDSQPPTTWMQMDTQISYEKNYHYRPFVCEVRTLLTSPSDPGINYFGWNLLGLPLMGMGVRYASEGLPAISWGVTAHYYDLVDVYELDYDYDPDEDEYWYKWNPTMIPARYRLLTELDDITVPYFNTVSKQLDEVPFLNIFETDKHGPVVKM